MKTFKYYLNEGINDPGIFKAVFLAGGPGSGKSFIAGRTGLVSLGLRLVNPDPAFENALKKAGMKTDPEDIFSPKGQAIRKSARELTDKQQLMYIKGRLGLIVDGTGKDFDKIARQKKALERLGYDTAMIFVNTDVETALKRNRERARTLPDDVVKKMWNDVQKNIGKFQGIFKNEMFVVDNSVGSNWNEDSMRAYKTISKWTKKPISNRIAKSWMAMAVKEKGAPAQPRKS